MANLDQWSRTYGYNYINELKNDNARFGASYAGFDDVTKKFNLSKLPDYENATEPYLSYIFMTRPSLNLCDNNLSALKANAMTAAFMNDYQSRSLMFQLSEDRSRSQLFIPLITNRAKSYTVSDVELKTTEKGGTYFGHLIKYAKHSEEHKVSGTISIDYRNDRFLSILKMHYLWMCYMYIVSKNDSLEIRDYYQQSGILDYAGSIYYMVTRRDGRELVYWEKLVGVFPIKVPFSMFTHNESMIVEDTVTIDYAYGIKADPCDPSILMDINVLHGGSDSYTKGLMTNDLHWYGSGTPGADHAQMNHYETPFVKGDVYASKPFVHMVKDSGGRFKYYLDFKS